MAPFDVHLKNGKSQPFRHIARRVCCFERKNKNKKKHSKKIVFLLPPIKTRWPSAYNFQKLSPMIRKGKSCWWAKTQKPKKYRNDPKQRKEDTHSTAQRSDKSCCCKSIDFIYSFRLLGDFYPCWYIRAQQSTAPMAIRSVGNLKNSFLLIFFNYILLSDVFSLKNDNDCFFFAFSFISLTATRVKQYVTGFYFVFLTDRWNFPRGSEGRQRWTGLQIRRLPVESRTHHFAQYDTRVRYPVRAEGRQLSHVKKR